MLSVPHYRDGFSYWHCLSSPSSQLEYSCGKSIRLPTSTRRKLWKRNNVLQRIRSPISYWYSIGISDSFTWFLFNKKSASKVHPTNWKHSWSFSKNIKTNFKKMLMFSPIPLDEFLFCQEEFVLYSSLNFPNLKSQTKESEIHSDNQSFKWHLIFWRINKHPSIFFVF